MDMASEDQHSILYIDAHIFSKELLFPRHCGTVAVLLLHGVFSIRHQTPTHMSTLHIF
jgi:hypothetical protein